MNKQGEAGGIEWTHIFGPGSGFTANPVRGCMHNCKWRMPDKTIVGCYAKAQKERMSGDGSFERITWHPSVFDDIRKRKKNAGIFIDSMSDLLGNEVKGEWIWETIKCMRECDQHVFFTLTKNPRRLLDFDWPNNCLVGISAPPAFMYGKELSADQQTAWLDKGLAWLSETNAKWKWISIEPLSFNIAPLLLPYNDVLMWAVIGAGSNGRTYYQPDEAHFAAALRVCDDAGIPVFYKGNLSRKLTDKYGRWRQDFPTIWQDDTEEKPDLFEPERLSRKEQIELKRQDTHRDREFL
jgi:protein gp37